MIETEVKKEVEFFCSRCAACCQKVNCEYLTEENLCSIYDHRPIMCNIEKMFKLIGGDLVIKKEDFFKLQSEFCKFLRTRKQGV